MIKAVLLDDETHCNEALHRQLKNHCPHIEVIGIFTRPADFLQFADKEDLDLVFLDIKMPSSNGFQVLEKLGARDINIIFITAYDHYAIKAFRYAAIDYLLKPVSDHDLLNSLERLNRLSQKKEQVSILKEMLQNTEEEYARVAIPSQDAFEFVYLKDIFRCEASRNYCNIWLQNQQQPILCSKPLKEVEKLLDSSTFVRVHSSHLVNKYAIRRFLKADGGSLELQNGTIIPIARLRKEWVLAQLMLR